MKYIWGFLFWFIYFPLVRMVCIILFWNSKIQDRIKFEKRNKFEWLAHSFHYVKEKADLCFEFSSEGEYQQVAPLIDDALKQGKKVELVFFSPSVEKSILNLASHYPRQIRYLRYPLLRLFPFVKRRCFSHWVTSSTLVMVRYDFFPEFLNWSFKRDHQLKLLWLTFKKERILGNKVSFWKKIFLNRATTRIYATETDLKEGQLLSYSGSFFDFRLEQINRRVLLKAEKFQTHFELYSNLKKIMEEHSTKLIFGNIWPEDLFLLEDLPQEVFLLLVPHKLNQEVLEQFRVRLKELGRNFVECDDQTKDISATNTVLLNKKGVLCELYSDFSYAYVGGGFGVSIHSVLEPLMAGSQSISCGPLHHRSTEYDLADSFGRITEINSSADLKKWLLIPPKTQGRDKINHLEKTYEKMRELIISC